MNEEKKEYQVVGSVTIGTDEYRDLIEAVKNAENETTNYRSKYWQEEEKRKDLEKQMKELQEYKTFVTEKCKSDFRLWKLKADSEDDF